MEKLNGLDRGYLSLDAAGIPADFLLILPLDPGAGHDVDRVRAEIRARAPRVAALVHRLVSAPFAGAPERWVVDPDFDPDRHLSVVTCPAPGDLGSLQRLALDLAARPLERDRPLWRAWYVAGPAEGPAALLLQLHHAAIDGVGAMALFGALFDTDPGTGPPTRALPPVRGERVPSGLELLVRTLPEQATAPWRAVRSLVSLTGARLPGLLAPLRDCWAGRPRRPC